MKKSTLVVIAFVALVLVAAGCSRRSRVIPPKDLSQIYYDFFMADQWFVSNPKARRTADTTNVYTPILKSYGYSLEDYEKSVRYYLRRPDRYAKIVKRTGTMLDEKGKRLQNIEDMLKKRPKFSPYQRKSFRYDTLVVGELAYEWKYIKNWSDSVARRDSIARALADSLALRDSIALVDSLALADSLAVSDSLTVVDSLAVSDSLVIDNTLTLEK